MKFKVGDIVCFTPDMLRFYEQFHRFMGTPELVLPSHGRITSGSTGMFGQQYIVQWFNADGTHNADCSPQRYVTELALSALSLLDGICDSR